MKARALARAAGVALTPSGKEEALVAFYAQLGRDGMTVSDLAEYAKIGRTTLTLMLNGTRSGRQSWKHVIPLLSSAALFRLKQCSAWNSYAEAAMLNWQRGGVIAFERGEGVLPAAT